MNLWFASPDQAKCALLELKDGVEAKKVYLEGLTKDWNEEKVKEICKKYGEILRVDTCLNPRSKNKDFGFITFASNVNDLARVTQVYKVYQEVEEQLFSCSKEDNRISEAMGLCLHNNAAIAASAAQAAGAKKDVHHGNGTQEIFEQNKTVFYISLHRHEGGKLYPGTCAAHKVGSMGGEGYCVNATSIHCFVMIWLSLQKIPLQNRSNDVERLLNKPDPLIEALEAVVGDQAYLDGQLEAAQSDEEDLKEICGSVRAHIGVKRMGDLDEKPFIVDAKKCCLSREDTVKLDQYEIGKFAESFEMIPKTLAENAELNAMEITSTLSADHANGNVKVGTDLEEGAWLMKANSSRVRRGKESSS
uniref:histone deacetylase n=1 Tax=Lactuca sativa TaxID=4236 RepID=A0A9R1X9H4_LACSA|nr:hypothetical protein LSAT_V11C500241640 [Lactuca sativa]